MPIVHGSIAAEVELSAERVQTLVERWSALSGQKAEHMTVNLSRVDFQGGAPYRVMATLWLPSAWPTDKREHLQETLAQSLAEACRCPVESVHVISTVVAAGTVVENGTTQHW